jgi:hypothetical protein
MMNFKLKTSLFLCVTFLSLKGIAQIDGSNSSDKGINIGVIETPVKEVEKPTSLNFNADAGFKKAHQNLKKQQQKKQQEEKENNAGIITPEMIAQYNFKKNVEGNFNNFPMIDMDLGSFHTKSEFIYISSFDFGRFDGDKVSFSVNGKVQQTNFLLTPNIKTIKIPLEVGINKVEVTALNEGELSPNTAYFAFFDQNKHVIKENQWTLAKGAKVFAIVVRDEK